MNPSEAYREVWASVYMKSGAVNRKADSAMFYTIYAQIVRHNHGFSEQLTGI